MTASFAAFCFSAVAMSFSLWLSCRSWPEEPISVRAWPLVIGFRGGGDGGAGATAAILFVPGECPAPGVGGTATRRSQQRAPPHRPCLTPSAVSLWLIDRQGQPVANVD